MNRIETPPVVPKQPWEKFEVGRDFAADLATNETIVLANSLVVAYTATGTEVTSQIVAPGSLATDGSKLTAWVQDGSVADGRYKLSFRAETSAGRRFERDLFLEMFD